jgi:hypothetical protein
MEATLTIQLPDGTTKTLELQNVSVSTSWVALTGSPVGTVEAFTDTPPPMVCNISLGGQVKTSSAGNSI